MTGRARTAPRVVRPLVAALAVASAVAAAPAAAHEVLHAVERGRAVAVRAYFGDGSALAYCEYEVWSPADAHVPWQKGRTDRDGWLAFVPDVRGAWRVRVMDGAAHALDLSVDVAPEAVAAGGGMPGAGPFGRAAFVLRPLLAVVGIVAAFGLLRLVYRRPGKKP